MFKQIANIANVMKQAQAMQGRLQELKESLERVRVTGSSANGQVEVDASGDQRILGVRIVDAAFEDRQRLDELIVQATNDALDRAKHAAAEAMQSATGGMGGMGDLLSQFGVGQ